MNGDLPALARARCDGSGLLLEAEEPLAGLQRRCGGTIPGAIAVPALAEVVEMARRFGLRLGRSIAAQDGEHAIRAWVDVVPGAASGGDGAIAITLQNWQVNPLPIEDPSEASRRHAEIDRALAELTASLDARQGVLAVVSDAADLAGLAAAMRNGLGRAWTDFVSLPGNAHRQPLHWRLLDGARVAIEGSTRSWRASLIPQGVPGADPVGFELCLTSETPAPPLDLEMRQNKDLEKSAAAGARPAAMRAVLGREIAPALRQPIARIIAHAETIRARLAGPLDEEYSRYAGDIAAAGQHLLELVDDLADLEAIEAEDFTTAPDPIDLADVARRAAGILSMRARERAIVLALPPEDASLPATAEFRRVLQVLLNLVGNAIRYAPQGSRVELLLEEEGGKARITVADEGPGLDAEQALRVFDKYERLGRSGDGGTGLGLYISRRLARAMGGDLTVASEAGQGARFTLEVPGRA